MVRLASIVVIAAGLAVPLVQPTLSHARSPVPSTARSRAAIQRVAPRLERDLAAKELRLGSPVFVRIFKKEHELEVWLENGERFERFRTYPICAWSGRLGPKRKTGDRQSPEGFYFVTPERMNPASRFHLSFNLGYPNAYDRHHGRTGSALMVHGNCVSIGCYAMTDRRIEEIYALADAALRAGQPYFRVHVFPFRMTPRNMERHRRSPWIDFWRNLKQGHDAFERTGRPPDVRVEEGRYVFRDP
jgi:murein L,D-transpeptidase YafK